MATLTRQTPGNPIVYASAAGGGDKFLNDGHTLLHIRNAGVGSITVTIDSQKPCDQGFDHDRTQVVGPSADVMLAAFDPNRFNDGSGFVNISYTGVTSVTVAAIASA